MIRDLIGTSIFLFFIGIGLSGQCFLDSPVDILATSNQSSRTLTLDVQNLQFSNLGVDQTLCGVFIEFEHGAVGNIRITLTSPSGQDVILVGPGLIAANASPFINWDVSFLRCDVPAVPDMGIAGVWDNGSGWASLTDYTGDYHPNQGCIEDYTGDAEGEWTITIQNLGVNTGVLSYFALQFCEGNASDCTTCDVFAGELLDAQLVICEGSEAYGDLQQFLIPPSGIDIADYLYTLTLPDGSIFTTAVHPSLEILAPGNYSYCGIAAFGDDRAEVLGLGTYAELAALDNDNDYCIDVTDCVDFSILPIYENENITEFLCPGEEYIFQNVSYTQALDTIIYTPSVSGTIDTLCKTATHLILNAIDITADIDDLAAPVVCGEVAILDASSSSTSLGSISAYTWSTLDGNFVNDIGPRAIVDRGGTYYLEVSDGRCSAYDTTTVIGVDTFITLVTQDDFLCPDDPLVLMFRDSIPMQQSTGGLSITEILNNPIGANPSIVGPLLEAEEAGDYTVVTQIGSCLDTIMVTLLPNPLPALTLSIPLPDTIGCTQASVTLILNTNVLNPSFDFSGPEPIPAGGSTGPSIYTPGIYTITVTDDALCSTSAMVEVIADPDVPTVRDTLITIDCLEDLSVFRLMPEVSGNIVRAAWVGPAGYSSDELQPIVSGPGIYKVEVEDDNGCTADGEVVLIITEVPILFMLGDTVIDCGMDSLVICPDLFSQSIMSYVWTDGIGDTLTDESCLTVYESGDYGFFVTSETGCTGYRDIRVENNGMLPEVIINVVDTVIYCDNAIELSSSGSIYPPNTRIQWARDGSILAAELNKEKITISAAGEYTLILYDSTTMCTGYADVTITEEDNLFSQLDFNAEDIDCGDEEVTLRIEPIEILSSLMANNEALSVITEQSLALGRYNFQLQDTNGCQLDTILDLTATNASFGVNLGDDIELDPGGSEQLTFDIIDGMTSPLGPTTLTWSPAEWLSCTDCLTPTATAPLGTSVTSYIVSLTITDAVGCMATDSLTITFPDPTVLIDKTDALYVPTIFDMSTQGIDRSLTIGIDTAIVQQLDMWIYDRWGNLVAASALDTLVEPSVLIWDGFYNNKRAEIGVYIYMANLLYVNGERQQVYGPITLLR